MSSSCAGGPKSGWRPRSGSASRSGLSEYGSNRSFRWRASPLTSSSIVVIESIVPPLAPPRDALHDECRLLQLARLLVQEPDAEVRRDRVEAAAVHDARAGLCRARVEAVDRLTDEERLAGQVDAVGPGVRACLDQRHAVLAVGPDRRGDDPAAFRERLHRLGVGRVGDDRRPVLAELRLHARELLLRAAREPDLHTVRSVLGEVLRSELADEPRRAKDDDVQVPIVPPWAGTLHG